MAQRQLEYSRLLQQITSVQSQLQATLQQAHVLKSENATLKESNAQVWYRTELRRAHGALLTALVHSSRQICSGSGQKPMPTVASGRTSARRRYA